MEREEAIESVRKLYNESLFLKKDKEAMVTLIPELAESEDERIRKEIIDFATKANNGVTSILANNYNFNKWIAWLEKQGEHANFLNKIQIGDKVTRNEDGVLVNLSQLNRVAKKDEKQGEQKETLCDKCKKEQPSHSCQDITALGRCALEKQGEQKPVDVRTTGYWHVEDVEQKPTAWSEEDENISSAIIKRLSGSDALSVSLQSAICWVENVKDRVQPQPKQEWSEEDEKMLSDIVKDLVHPWNEYIPDRIEEEIKWLKNKLKSLRPQSYWKPSEGQMELLREVQQALLGKDCHNRFVDFMYELKRLREE